MKRLLVLWILLCMGAPLEVMAAPGPFAAPVARAMQQAKEKTDSPQTRKESINDVINQVEEKLYTRAWHELENSIPHLDFG